LYECALECYRHAHRLAPEEFEYAYLLAIAADLAGRGDGESVEFYHRALKLRPDFAPGWCRLGLALERLGRHDEALAANREAITQSPGMGMAHRGVGQILNALGRGHEAVDYLKSAVALEPRDGAAFAALAHAYRLNGEMELSREAAERARTLEPMYDVPDPIRQAVKAQAVDSWSLQGRARSLLGSGKRDEAVTLFKTVLVARPGDGGVHYELATCYKNMNQLRLAAEHFERAIDLEYDRADAAQLELASVLIRLDELGNALLHYREAARAHPDNAEIHKWIGDDLLRQRYFREAAAAYSEATRLAPNDAQAAMMCGVAAVNLGRSSEAVEHYRRAIELRPTYSEAHFNLGVVLKQLGDEESARVHFALAESLADP
jgi:tetratricopeptide (TPR) repeat protein